LKEAIPAQWMKMKSIQQKTLKSDKEEKKTKFNLAVSSFLDIDA
jgi:hypothetical protein